MTEFFRSGHAADLLLAVLAVEWLLLARRWGRRRASAAVLPGAFFALALRSALTGAAWPWIAASLIAAGAAHAVDLAVRPSRRG